MKKTVSNYLINVLIVLGLSGIVVYFIFRNDADLILETIHNINPYWLIFIVFLVLLGQLLQGLVLTLLTRLSNKNYPLKFGVINSLIASFVSGITPSSTGGQIAQIYAYKKQGVHISDSVSILWMDFIIFQTTICLVTIVLFAFKFLYFFNTFSNYFIFALLGLLMNIVIIFGLYAIIKFPKFYTFITTKLLKLGAKLKVVKDEEQAVNSLNDKIERFQIEVEKLKKHKALILKCSILHTIRFIVLFSIPYFCFLAVNYEVSPTKIIDAIALASFVSMLNTFFPMPGASGGTEFTYILMFSTIFNSLYVKVTVIIWRFLTYYFVMFLGMIAFLYVKLKKELPLDTHREVL